MPTNRASSSGDLTSQQIKTGCLAAVALVAALFLVITIAKSLNTIDAGDQGVVVCFGQTSGSLDPGLHLVAPWCGVEGLNARTDTYVMVARGNEGAEEGDDSLGVRSSDQVPLAVDAGVIHRIDRGRAEDLYRRYKNVATIETVLRNTSRRIVSEAAAGFTAEQLTGSGRAAYGAAARDKLAPALAEFGVIVEGVEIRDVRSTSAEYTQAIAAKVSAQQAAAAKDFQLQAAQKDAEIKRVNAEADATAQRIRNSQPPDPALVQQQMVDAIKTTNNRVIVTDGKTPVLLNPGG